MNVFAILTPRQLGAAHRRALDLGPPFALCALTVALVGCQPDFHLDRYTFACAGDAGCASGACHEGACREVEADATATQAQDSHVAIPDTHATDPDSDAAVGQDTTTATTADATTPGDADTAHAPTGPSPMATIPGGTFAMGSPEGEAGRGTDEPTHSVVLSAYAIDRFEATNAAYLGCVNAGRCDAPTTCAAGAPVWTGPTSFPEAAASEPVRCVTWAMARDYCDFVGKRLCTEAEWERGCVGSAEHRTFPWGSAWPPNPDAHCNCDEGWCHDSYPAVAPIGSFPRGRVPELSLHDMAGNVSEWVLDFYEADAYVTGTQADPRGPCEGAAPCDARFLRVHRGGSYAVDDAFVRCASRGQRIATSPEPFVGIRCCAQEPP